MARLLFLVKGRLPASQELPREIKCVERASETWRVQLGNSSSEGLGMWLHWQSDCLPYMKPWLWSPELDEPCGVVDTYKSSTQEAEAEGLQQIQRNIWLHIESEVSLDSYIVRTSQKQARSPTTGVTAHTFNPSSKKVEESPSSLQSAFLSYIEFQASLGYTARICLNK